MEKNDNKISTEIKTVDLELYKKLLDDDVKRKEHSRKKRVENREHYNEYQRNYQKLHKEKAKARVDAWNEKNKEHNKVRTGNASKKYLAFWKLYKDKHPEFLSSPEYKMIFGEN
jgi:hypothetical protein